MDFHFLVMEKSWKINVEKEGAPCLMPLLPPSQSTGALLITRMLFLKLSHSQNDYFLNHTFSLAYSVY